MSELTKLRIIEKDNLEPYLQTWKDFEWLIQIRDDFGGIITGTYKTGPALIEAIHRLNYVVILSAKEKEELEQLEQADPQKAQDKLNKLVRARADMFYSSLIQHFIKELRPSIREAINNLVSKVVDLMIMEFSDSTSPPEGGSKKRGPKPLFVNKGHCMTFITYVENLIKARGDRLTLSAIAREIMTLKGREEKNAYRVLRQYMDKFGIEWTPEGGVASKL